jgi:hypothetical protein
LAPQRPHCPSAPITSTGFNNNSPGLLFFLFVCECFRPEDIWGRRGSGAQGHFRPKRVLAVWGCSSPQITIILSLLTQISKLIYIYISSTRNRLAGMSSYTTFHAFCQRLSESKTQMILAQSLSAPCSKPALRPSWSTGPSRSPPPAERPRDASGPRSEIDEGKQRSRGCRIRCGPFRPL